MAKLNKKEKWLIASIVLLLILITLLTKFQGGADIYDYQDVAKFFAGKYNAKIRTSHSYLYGFIHTPFVYLFENFFAFKITNLIFLFLIIYSVYIISKRDKRALWLILLSPILWYMAPWTSPIQLASLLFLWGWYFIKKYDSEKNSKKSIKYLLYSGLLLGLSWAFWDGVLFFIPLLIISFFYDKRLSHTIYFIIVILLGSLPRIILDQILFGFAFFTPVRHIMASLALTFLGGFYEQGSLFGVISLIFVIIFFPVFTYLIFKKKIFIQNKKTSIFILLSILLLIINSQIRFTLLIVPIIIITLSKSLTKKQFTIQIIFSLILIVLVLNPYILQIKWDIGENGKGVEFEYFIRNIQEIKLDDRLGREVIKSDIQEITREYPGETFVVGNTPDYYRVLANIYFGEDVKEFVSIEDYNLNIMGENLIAKKEFCTNTLINTRRDFCFSLTNLKSFGDKTDYDSIKYGIGEEDLDIAGFTLLKEYKQLNQFVLK